MNKNLSLILALIAGVSANALASDFDLSSLPKFDTSLDLNDFVGKTYYDFMAGTLKSKMLGQQQRANDDDLLKAGKGVSIRLNDQDYNVHVNFYNNSQGGRSYGWTRGQVGDWSDAAILGNVQTVSKGSDSELRDFYTTLVQMVGDCDAKNLAKLTGMTERVATNFLAIYGAEAYRATLGTKNWDDALFETMMLAAFHGGQKTFTKYYMGTFQNFSFKQQPGVYNSHGPIKKQPDATDKKPADMIDYWQFTVNLVKTDPSTGAQRPDHDSGINETRPDFEKMGQTITAFYGKNNADIAAIEGIVKGKGTNVIKDITQYFASGNANASATDQLAGHVANFLVQVRADAEKISATAK